MSELYKEDYKGKVINTVVEKSSRGTWTGTIVIDGQRIFTNTTIIPSSEDKKKAIKKLSEIGKALVDEVPGDLKDYEYVLRKDKNDCWSAEAKHKNNEETVNIDIGNLNMMTGDNIIRHEDDKRQIVLKRQGTSDCWKGDVFFKDSGKSTEVSINGAKDGQKALKSYLDGLEKN